MLETMILSFVIEPNFTFVIVGKLDCLIIRVISFFVFYRFSGVGKLICRVIFVPHYYPGFDLQEPLWDKSFEFLPVEASSPKTFHWELLFGGVCIIN